MTSPPHLATQADPEGARRRWKDLTQQREIIAEAAAAEVEEIDADLSELRQSLMRGDLSAVATFVKHQPFLSGLVLTPVLSVALLTRYPPLALALLKIFPQVGEGMGGGAGGGPWSFDTNKHDTSRTPPRPFTSP